MTSRWSRITSFLNQLNLNIPQPFELNAFIRSVEEFRGRKIEIVPVDFGIDRIARGIVAWWWSFPDIDCVIIDRSAPKPLQEHGVLHEIAHMLLEHVGQRLAHTIAAQFRQLDSHAVLRALARDINRYDDPDEADAETLATLIPIAATLRLDTRPTSAASGHVRGRSKSGLSGVPSTPVKHHLYRNIRPLWERLIDTPGVSCLEPLPTQPHPAQLDLLLRRMVVESLDGLHRLRHLHDPSVAAAARTRATAAGLHPERATSVAEAAAITTAITRARHPPRGHHRPPAQPGLHHTQMTRTWGPTPGSGFAAHSIWLATIGQVLPASPAPTPSSRSSLTAPQLP
ncbi:DUF6545 domain-containing protein [Catenuloplanes japonicus]|uniref:DUF6545 domain-containing protein n=1 Tax=Catenuloplanes japonicus TaxID=33876 RepID=UPI0038B94E28